MSVPNTKKKKMSIRIPLRLYEMIQDLLPLFDYNETAVIVDILKKYEYSNDHKLQHLKLDRARYIVYHRDLELRRKFKDPKPGDRI